MAGLQRFRKRLLETLMTKFKELLKVQFDPYMY